MRKVTIAAINQSQHMFLSPKNHRVSRSSSSSGRRSFVQWIALAALAVAGFGATHSALAGNAKAFFQNSALTNAANYSPPVLPTNTDDVLITTPSSNNPLLITSASVVMESLSVINGSGYIIGNNTTGATSRTLTLGNTSGFINNWSGVSNDLIYLSGGSSLSIQGPNLQSGQTTGTGTLGLVLASTGNFNVGTASVLSISSVISGVGMGISITGGGTTIFKGTNTYSGDTQILNGDLRFDNGGTSNSSTIRLGATSGSDTAVLSLGGSNLAGNNVGSALEVRSGSSGAKVLRQLDTTGTNTYSGAITLNSGLTIESATGGNFLFQGGSIDVKTNTLMVDSQIYNVGTGLNGSDNVNMRGTVTINEVLGSSLATGGALVKDGSSTLILQGTSNTYTGTNAAALNTSGTTIKGGVLGIYGDGSLGLAPSTATNNIFFAASSASNPTATRTLQDTMNDISLAATRNVNVASGVTGTFDSNGHTFTINGVINGDGAIATTGANGTVVFTGANTYSGGTTVQGGTLLVNNSTGSGTGSGGVLVNSGAILGGGGAINTGANNVTINGSVAPGSAANAIGSLTLTTNSTVFGNGSTFLVDLGGGTSDLLATSGTFDLTALNNTISFNTLSTLTAPSYTLATYTGPALGIFENTVNLPSGYTLIYNVGELDLVNLSLVPEPSAWVAAALAALAVAFTQRRRVRQTLKR